MVSFILPGNSASGGYEVANSLRLNNDSSDYLVRSLGSQSSLRIGTFSYWVKRSSTDIGLIYFNEVENDNNRGYIQFENDGTWRMVDNDNSGDHIVLKTNRLFRDFGSWYHICVRVDTTQSTSTDRVRLYVNGVQETSFSSTTYPSQNDDLKIFQGGQTNKNTLGAGYPASNYYDGYMAEFVYCDGQSLAPTSFGEFDEDSEIWKPIDVSGLTFGNNGFYLDFENSGSLGADASGNGNNFTVNNLTSIDQSTDTCTNNFVTLNPLGNHLPNSTFSEGNLKVTFNSSNYSFNNSTIGVSAGKWYFETKIITTATNNQNLIGISDRDSIGTTDELGSGAYQYALYGGNSGGDSPGRIRNNNSYHSYSNGTTYTANDIIGTYVDLDNNKIYFAKNGTILNSGTGYSITAPASTDTGFYFLSVGSYSGSNSPVYEVNFGNPTFSISSGNSDPAGYGNFEYSPNDGGSASFDSSAKDFYALNTKNLAEYG